MSEQTTPTPESAGGATGDRSILKIARDGLGLTRTPLYRNASALILGTITNGVLGLVYWVLAARSYDADDVGRGAVGVSALMLVSMLGFTGLQFALIRFIPASGRGTARLALSAYGAACGVAVLFGVGLLLATWLFIEPLRFLTSNPVHVLAFLGAILVWVVFSLEDGVLTGLRRAGWVPLENAVFGLLKIVFLIAFAFLGGTWAIFASWFIAAALMVAPVNAALFLKFIPEHAESTAHRTGEFSTGDVVRFSVGNHISGTMTALPDSLMPIIVLYIAGATASAYFYAARSIVMSLRLIAMNIANALTAEAATSERDLGRLTRWAGILAIAVFLPVILLLVFEGRLVLTMFGQEYADNGTVLIRLFALGLIPFALVSLYTAMARVRRELGRLIILALVSTGLNLSLGIILVSAIGIEGAGIAWLTAQTGAATVAVWMWPPRLFLDIWRRVAGLRTDPRI